MPGSTLTSTIRTLGSLRFFSSQSVETRGPGWASGAPPSARLAARAATPWRMGERTAILALLGAEGAGIAASAATRWRMRERTDILALLGAERAGISAGFGMNCRGCHDFATHLSGEAGQDFFVRAKRRTSQSYDLGLRRIFFFCFDFR